MRHFTAVATLIILLSGCKPEKINQVSSSGLQTEIDAVLAERLDAFIQKNVAKDAAGVAMLVTHHQKIVYQNTRGMANLVKERAITEATGFRLASVSKSFTALAIMQLYEQGLLSLDDSLTDLIPELSANAGWSAITIQHLLSHQSGIPDYINDVPAYFYSEEANSMEVLAVLATGPALEFTPGSSQQYSNSGYFLLSEIVSRISHKSFADYMDKHIFQPLGMANSYILDRAGKRRPGDALSYGRYELLFGKLWLAPGASSQVSSLNDFAAFFLGLTDHKVVKKSTLELMLQTHSTGIFGRNYGYGFMINAKDPLEFGHGGLLGGFSSEMRLHAGGDWQVIVLYNATGSAYALASMVGEYYDEFP